MGLVIDLPKPVEERVEAEARKAGVTAARYAADVLAREVGIPPRNLAAVALLRSWREEDETDDEEELTRRDRETAELHRNLNAARMEAGEEPLFPLEGTGQ